MRPSDLRAPGGDAPGDQAREGLSTASDKLRRRRTRDECAQLRQQIIEVLASDHPQSVRHVFYRMTDPRLPEPVEKSENGYRHVQYQMTEMRRLGLLPYGWVTDATRRGYFVDTFDSAADFLTRVAGLYRADLWAQAEHHVEVWVESRSIAAVIERDCEALAVSLYPAGGFTSLTLAWQAAVQLNKIVARNGRSVEIVYIGDYDPAGVLVDLAIERELRAHLNPSVEMNFRRIAVNPDQIAAWELPTKPRKEADRRARHIIGTVEAEAIPARTLRALLREEVERFVPVGALAAAKAAEASEKLRLIDLARSLSERDG